MTDLRKAAQQALEALQEYQSKGAPFLACDGAVAALRAALAQQDEPCPNCSSLEAQNTELDRKLAELDQDEPVQEPVAWLYEAEADRTLHWNKPPLYGTPLYTAPPKPQTLDEALTLPRAMAQAYKSGYNAGAAAERERIIQFLTEMQRVVGDAHNHYGVAAVRIKERV